MSRAMRKKVFWIIDNDFFIIHARGSWMFRVPKYSGPVLYIRPWMSECYHSPFSHSVYSYRKSDLGRVRWVQRDGWRQQQTWAISHVYVGNECLLRCSGHGTCDAGVCRCQKGWTGKCYFDNTISKRTQFHLLRLLDTVGMRNGNILCTVHTHWWFVWSTHVAGKITLFFMSSSICTAGTFCLAR